MADAGSSKTKYTRDEIMAVKSVCVSFPRGLKPVDVSDLLCSADLVPAPDIYLGPQRGPGRGPGFALGRGKPPGLTSPGVHAAGALLEQLRGARAGLPGYLPPGAR
ncbi:hypothetical protein APUTEX25_003868 [Auxenochlorella protothecoides]|uniref:Uncharacterized protein n=1 Tax=Auxenochlorella protothecoides TaxID=3075 RepID=A0A3M7L2Z4_AUXPR|nr:hypothetical protein APUTEX25_003868 [Auxenochlorella protothecoides]|eukprot:RMZ55902.1 hypothetical protein APUTEX25_003868 [Auxenochlorella protothecoides]